MIHSLYVYGTRVFYYDPFHVPGDSWDFAVVNPYIKGAKASLSITTDALGTQAVLMSRVINHTIPYILFLTAFFDLWPCDVGPLAASALLCS